MKRLILFLNIMLLSIFVMAQTQEYLSYQEVRPVDSVETISIDEASSVSADGQPCPGAATVKDYDGNVYNTVQIGKQCWMKENLRTTKYADGTDIQYTYYKNSKTVPYRYELRYTDRTHLDRDPCQSWYPIRTGYQYNWSAVMRGAPSSNSNPSGVQGLCPNGWHVPSIAEWKQLLEYVGSQSRYVCGKNSAIDDIIGKPLCDTCGGWLGYYDECPSTTANATGFSVVRSGFFGYYSNEYYDYCARYWSTTLDSWLVEVIVVTQGRTFRTTSEREDGLSVRCLRD